MTGAGKGTGRRSVRQPDMLSPGWAREPRQVRQRRTDGAASAREGRQRVGPGRMDRDDLVEAAYPEDVQQAA